MIDRILKIIKPLNDFMNDNDRGPGHGIGYGVFYGFVLLPCVFFGPWFVLGVCLANHARVMYEELFIENWKQKYNGSPYQGDFWYDSIFRPLQTDIFLFGVGFCSPAYWSIVVIISLVCGIKRKDEWPLLMFWK